MKIYADWASTKEWVVLKEDSPENLAYIETGCPKRVLLDKLDELGENFKVYIIDGKETKRLRKERGLDKTDENDAELVKELANTNPELFIELKERNYLEIKAQFITSKYVKLTRIIAGIKNRRKAYEKEYGESEEFKEVIKPLEKEKRRLLKSVTPLFDVEAIALKNLFVTGIGPAITSEICALAHPNKFKSINSYLKYLGFIDRSSLPQKERWKYNRDAKSVYYQLASGQIMHKGAYEPLYRELKEKEILRNLTCGDCSLTKLGVGCKKRKDLSAPRCKGSIDRSAKNKLSTHIARDVYKILHHIKRDNSAQPEKEKLDRW